MSYNKETDYQEKINEAVKNGDYESAARYEKSRNEKIDGENLGYEKTNRYQGWLDKTDYSTVLKSQMSQGASRDEVSDTLRKRISKASGTDGLTKYAYDDVYDEAIRYIMGNGAYSYESYRPYYENSYENDLKKLYDKLSNIKEFRYNPYEDELYNYYRQEYLREGKRAMEDLLGELSSNTDGVASSYAVSAASQSLDRYNERLTDKIPELYEAAYERYLDNIERQTDNFDRLKELSDAEYKRYLDSIEGFRKDRDFDYEKFRNTLEDEKEEEELDREYEYLLKKLALDEKAQALKEWEASRKWR